MNRSTRSHPDMVPPMMNPESASHASQDPPFETARNETHDDVLISALEATLNDKREPWSNEAAAAANEGAPVKNESRQISNRHTNEGDVIAREVRSAVSDLVTTELATVLEESLENILRESFHNWQSGIRSVVYNVLEQVILDLLRKDVIGETLEAHIGKVFDTDEAAEGL